MQKIAPHLWFDKEAKEAAEFYVATFPNSRIVHAGVIHDTPSGDCDVMIYEVMGYAFMSISAGPLFTINPSISFSVNLRTKEETQALWDKLSDGGEVFMPLQEYPFSEFYGWVSDKYGVSWQLIALGDKAEGRPAITPSLMFTQNNAGKAQEALEFYTSVFKNSKIGQIWRYGENPRGEKAENISHAEFFLEGQEFMMLESAGPHKFTFSEGVSLMVNCDSQEEIDYYWEKLSAVPEAEQCGWLKDKYGVSWQIQPERINEMMMSGTPEQIARVIKAFLPMKKFDLATLEQAFVGM